MTAPDPVEVTPTLDEADAILAEAGGHDGIGEPHEYSTPRLPRLGEVIRDAERLAAQLIAVLERDIDPASAPTALAWEGIGSGILAHDILLADAAISAKAVLRKLHLITKLPMPPAGSAVGVKFEQSGEVDVLKLAELIKAAKSGGAL